MSLSAQSVVTVTKDQVSCNLGPEAAILNMKDGIYYGLDPVGAEVWKLLQTPRKVADIHEALLQEYDVEPERCQRDLLALLEDLLGAGLIEVRLEAPDSGK
jgi:Coenzyme PQQ synthesis protein D (PqqD)